MSVAFQHSLFGEPPVVSGDVKQRIAWLLRKYPETRANYKALMARYWAEFDGLKNVLGEKTEAFVAWFSGKGATSPKTLQNRAMEVQNENPALEAPPEVERWRQAQSRAGPVVW